MANQEKLTYSSMTFPLLESKYNIREGKRLRLFEVAPQVQPSTTLLATIERGRHTFLVNERARAYRLIDPVLAELEALREGKIVSMPEIDLVVPEVEGLCGTPDFVISGGMTSKVLPIATIVEAKRDNLDAGLPQCIAELYASYLLNQKHPKQIHGCVTNGDNWRMIRLDGDKKIAHVDLDTYYIVEPARLLGVLCHIVDAALADLPNLPE